ncbi:hypothetical protein CONPUDRAFT_157668 [Coniophora puteana RWD-64-598 SS2]|uniref:Uncharacterized protein n=1 Tax=Coniophora puteana (strain RWD-64-598) TaxID=741705 RepID=A0A5M3MDS4_CONPW|nr:uncharacterized protein CONPUDRAFT_157668 [Coniophora puteana RWD-64-598 SS2]EIW77419.1 hypothetical protein CONPUDRAFT_157668 [Coniophora puteana RWD-64-598 SS2]
MGLLLANMISLDALETFCISDMREGYIYSLRMFTFTTGHQVKNGSLTAAQLIELTSAWSKLREFRIAKPGIEFTLLEASALRRRCPWLQTILYSSIRTDKHNVAALTAYPGLLERVLGSDVRIASAGEAG